MPGAARLVAVAAALTAAATAPTHAGDAPAGSPAEALAIDVVGACPDAETVRRLLAALVSADEARAAPVSVQDRGDRYRISVRKTAMMLEDPGRDCAERARRAAVIAAGELHAPKVVYGPPSWTVEKGLVFDVAPTTGALAWAPGAEIRSAWGSNAWSLVGAAGARGPVTLELENGWQAELLRFPLDGAARLTSYRWRLRPWVMFGGSATVTGIIGHQLVDTDRVWRLDFGALAMAGATLRVTGRLGVAAAIAVRWQPRPYQLNVAPAGHVGETPAWWFGLSLNYTLDGKPSTPP